MTKMVAETEERVTRSKGQIAALFKVSEPTVGTWISQGCPVVEEGGKGRAYELNPYAVSDWLAGCGVFAKAASARDAEQNELFKRDLLGDGSLSAQGEGAGMSPAARRQTVQVEMDLVKLARMKGELVERDKVRDDFLETFKIIRTSIMGLPDRLIRELNLDPELHADVDRLALGFLNELSQKVEELEGDYGSQDSD